MAKSLSLAGSRGLMSLPNDHFACPRCGARSKYVRFNAPDYSEPAASCHRCGEDPELIDADPLSSKEVDCMMFALGYPCAPLVDLRCCRRNMIVTFSAQDDDYGTLLSLAARGLVEVERVYPDARYRDYRVTEKGFATLQDHLNENVKGGR